MPLPGTRVIGDGWAAHHRTAAAHAMTSRCNIARLGTGEGEWNPETGRTDPPPATPIGIDLRCRVQATATSEDPADVGGTVHTLRAYLVTLLYDAPTVRVDDEVTVTDPGPNGDPQMAGETLRVIDVHLGSLHWQRNLICEHNAG